MIDFWLPAGLLLLVAMSFLLVPLLRGRKAQAEEDRTALNVALYQERVAELQAQQAAGTLTAEQLDLHHIRQMIFNRVFDGDDIQPSPADGLQHGVQRGGFA